MRWLHCRLVSTNVRKMFPQAMRDIKSEEHEDFGAQILKQLADSGTDIDRKFMAFQGAIPALVSLLNRDDARVQEISIKALVALCKRCDGNVRSMYIYIKLYL
jgi:hypothetical protein